MKKRLLFIISGCVILGLSLSDHTHAASYPTTYNIALSQDQHIVQLQGTGDSVGKYTSIQLPSTAKYIQARIAKKNDVRYVAIVFQVKRKIRLRVYHPNGTELVNKLVEDRTADQAFGHFSLDTITLDGKRASQVRLVRQAASGEFTRYVNKKYYVRPNTDAVLKKAEFSSKKITEPAVTGDDTIDTIRWFNYYRKKSGVVPVKRDSDLARGCKKHVAYMVANDTLTHTEDSSKPGYTKEGAAAGPASDLAAGVPGVYESVQLWMHSLYHRIPMLNPALTTTGYAYSSDGGYSCIHLSTRDSTVYRFDYPPVMFPAPGMTNVPTTFNSGETPDPLDDQGGSYPAGEVVTLTFSSGTTITKATIHLQDSGGNSVSGYPRLPGDSSDPYVVEQGTTISFIPKSPLKKHTTYTMTMTGVADGDAFNQSWSFTTGAQ